MQCANINNSIKQINIFTDNNVFLLGLSTYLAKNELWSIFFEKDNFITQNDMIILKRNITI